MMQNIDPRTPMSSLAVYGTQDGGRTWKVSPVIIDDVDAFPAVDFVTPQDAFMVCRDNLCVTHDGAQNWETLTSNLVFDSSAPTGEHISHFDFVNIQAGWAITTNAAGSTSTLWKTNDGGRTWRKLSPSMAK
jgi:photosystem II stability/assembly factor-like uncharacterized protein